MNEKFVWREYLYGRKAETEIGCYFVFDNARQDAFMEAGTSFAAFFQPPQGRARLPKHKQGLGCFETLRAAQERCELKAREGGTEETLKTSPVAILKAKLVQQTRQIAHLEEQLAAAEHATARCSISSATSPRTSPASSSATSATTVPARSSRRSPTPGSPSGNRRAEP
jgi:hypothetical protein